jgi:hypothetical protein
MFATGAGNRIVGVMSDSDFVPPASKRIPIVGNVNGYIDLERILYAVGPI